MTQDDIIRMAREAGFQFNSLGASYTSGALPDLLKRFAALVAAAEREECAKMYDEIDDDDYYLGSQYADMIRARGQK